MDSVQHFSLDCDVIHICCERYQNAASESAGCLRVMEGDIYIRVSTAVL